MAYEMTFRRTPVEYDNRLNEAIAAAQGGDWQYFNERFRAALEKRGLTLAMRKHPKTADDWFPPGGPRQAPESRPGADAWPAAAVVVWRVDWFR